ncbi:epimerase [Actinoplanes sp. SE50]|uniref:NAD-dependent epimerase/dehydratase family protein n=1 Tax=unclassified Actinoplanes TaxID=2626549 RepID=UPI00023EBB95|nr:MULTISPECIES: NAD(P)-dependent oxidoreductase [unclassified Actinoplanes]AEV84502.1 ADP-L-glycero-D-manno-heptose-6-epimerase [Actinoplanes sp. SE50/110]ATO82894.1 epimerase [Actinoplanes sp. SE50]SLM00302.1 epimerase [Actinoplanes sp. SE50/110]
MRADLGTVVITGAAGRIGSVVRRHLRADVRRLVLVDRVPLSVESPVEQTIRLDLADLDAVAAAMAGADAVVHLAGLPDEAPMADLLDSNVLGTYHVLEAARRHRVGRVVLAGSNRVTGFYPVGQVVTPDDPVRPDGFYGVSKVAVEALGRLYADKFGLSVVCLRIGSFEDEPTEARYLATWLSPRDGVGFIRAAITAPDVHFVTAYAVSANTRRFWDTAAGAQIGYQPVDNAETYAARVPGSEATTDSAAVQGGAYASPEYSLRHAVTPPPSGVRGVGAEHAGQSTGEHGDERFRRG